MNNKADLNANSVDQKATDESTTLEILKRLNGSTGRGEPDQSEETPYGGLDLQEVSGFLVSKRRPLFTITISGALVAGLIAVALPSMYTATALIIPPAKPQSLSTLLMGQLGGLAGAFAPSLGGLKDPNDMYIGILRSRTINDDIVSQFGLQQVYSLKTTEEARRKLIDRTTVVLGRDSMIKISVEDRDPKRAAEMTNAFITELSVQNNRLALTESGQRRLFFEREVNIEKNDLVVAEGKLREIQQRTGVVEVGNQAQMVMGSIARMRAEITMQEVSLERLKMGATTENPEVAKRQTGLSALKGELAKLETGNIRQPSGDPLVPVANVPQAGLEYLRGLREVKYHESLFEVLAKQYEAARIDEAREAPVIQVVDAAIPPQRRSGPPRGLIIVFGPVFSSISGAIWMYFARDRAANEQHLRNRQVELSTP